MVPKSGLSSFIILFCNLGISLFDDQTALSYASNKSIEVTLCTHMISVNKSIEVSVSWRLECNSSDSTLLQGRCVQPMCNRLQDDLSLDRQLTNAKMSFDRQLTNAKMSSDSLVG